MHGIVVIMAVDRGHKYPVAYIEAEGGFDTEVIRVASELRQRGIHATSAYHFVPHAKELLLKLPVVKAHVDG